MTKYFYIWQEDLKTYCCSHPEYEPKSIKNFLNKAEQRLVDKEAGKPEKPPPYVHCSYSLNILNSMYCMCLYKYIYIDNCILLVYMYIYV